MRFALVALAGIAAVFGAFFGEAAVDGTPWRMLALVGLLAGLCTAFASARFTNPSVAPFVGAIVAVALVVAGVYAIYLPYSMEFDGLRTTDFMSGMRETNVEDRPIVAMFGLGLVALIPGTFLGILAAALPRPLFHRHARTGDGTAASA